MKLYLNLILLAILVVIPNLSQAVVSCGSYSGKLIGVEAVATSCNASIHIMTGIECRNGEVSLWSHQGDWSYGADTFANYYASQGYRVFRNTEGTRIVAVDKRYTETIDGLSMLDYVTGVVHLNVFDKVLYPQTAPLDSDNDHYLSCDECNDSDPTVNPGTVEICNDGIDNNCDGSADCDDTTCEEDTICSASNNIDPENFPVDCKLEN